MLETPDNEKVKQEGCVKSVSENDVLCGRGSGPNDHCGNVAFRELVSTRRREYLETSTRAQKARIAREIVDVVKSLNPPGRFLEKVTETSWNEASEEKALEKVKQALRQMRHRRAESLELKKRSILQRDSWMESSHRRINSAPPYFGREYMTGNIPNTTQNCFGVSPVSVMRTPTFCDMIMPQFPNAMQQQMTFNHDRNNYHAPMKQNIVAFPEQTYSSINKGHVKKHSFNNSEDTMEPYPFRANNSVQSSSDNLDLIPSLSSIGTIEIDDHQIEPRSYPDQGKDESMEDYERLAHVLKDSEPTLPDCPPPVHPQYSSIQNDENQDFQSRYY